MRNLQKTLVPNSELIPASDPKKTPLCASDLGRLQHDVASTVSKKRSKALVRLSREKSVSVQYFKTLGLGAAHMTQEVFIVPQHGLVHPKNFLRNMVGRLQIIVFLGDTLTRVAGTSSVELILKKLASFHGGWYG